ncbi:MULTISPECIES: LysR family transcriptional regulator [unclassified Guyparkeria]|uniref:LysR family transcriptional regulator n=1 Tax=unclassified Guyparkeria TaxID=2626246 RepID=UPI0007337D91|nr:MULTISPECIES: LysR family transcriptional regulator [unclassified Guyparkeria]KTG16767.1 XRE family transcriptional regulator [Guyparkeria sp. XI15]OAE85801.1 XRE family transcriptional regulator [Guyparkeria sp. WRN-7]
MFLELRHLKTIRAIEQTGSLAAAADRLHLTQSALSHQIRALESYYETPLFSRSSRPMRLTEAGRRLLAGADVILPEIERLDRDLRQIAGGATGRLFLALECHSCFTWLIPTLEHYRAQWPSIETDLSMSLGFDAIDALRDGRLDGVISSDPIDDPELHFEPLFRYPVVLALAPGHPLANETRIEPEMLADQTVIGYPVDRERLDIYRRFLDPAGIEPANSRQSELTAMIAQWVASGHGVAALPKWAIADELERGIVTARPLGDGMSSTMHLAVRRDEHRLAYMDAFLRLAREQAGQRLDDISLVRPSR